MDTKSLIIMEASEEIVTEEKVIEEEVDQIKRKRVTTLTPEDTVHTIKEKIVILKETIHI
jgi:hypothetical protein